MSICVGPQLLKLVDLEVQYKIQCRDMGHNIMTSFSAVACAFFNIAKSYYSINSSHEEGNFCFNKSIKYFCRVFEFSKEMDLDSDDCEFIYSMRKLYFFILCFRYDLKQLTLFSSPMDMEDLSNIISKLSGELFLESHAYGETEDVKTYFKKVKKIFTYKRSGLLILSGSEINQKEGNLIRYSDKIRELIHRINSIENHIFNLGNETPFTIQESVKEQKTFSELTAKLTFEKHQILKKAKAVDRLEKDFFHSYCFTLAEIYASIAKQYYLSKEQECGDQYFNFSLKKLNFCEAFCKDSTSELIALLSTVVSLYKVVISERMLSQTQQSLAQLKSDPIDLQLIFPIQKVCQYSLIYRSFEPLLVEGERAANRLFNLIYSLEVPQTVKYQYCNDAMHFLRLLYDMYGEDLYLNKLIYKLRLCIQWHPDISSQDFTKKSDLIYYLALAQEKNEKIRNTSRSPSSQRSRQSSICRLNSCPPTVSTVSQKSEMRGRSFSDVPHPVGLRGRKRVERIDESLDER